MISTIISRSCGERTTAVDDNDDEDSWTVALAGKSGGVSDGGPKCDDVVNVTGGDTDSVPGSDSRPLARQGTVIAALRLIRDEGCDREE